MLEHSLNWRSIGDDRLAVGDDTTLYTVSPMGAGLFELAVNGQATTDIHPSLVAAMKAAEIDNVRRNQGMPVVQRRASSRIQELSF